MVSNKIKIKRDLLYNQKYLKNGSGDLFIDIISITSFDLELLLWGVFKRIVK